MGWGFFLVVLWGCFSGGLWGDLVSGFGFVFLPKRKEREVEITSKLITDFGALADDNEESHGRYSKEGDFPHLQNRNDGN